MAHTCIEHPHEPAEGLCRRCGASYCADCLVYPFGPTKPPYCVPCAVASSGVRTNAANPTRVVPKETKKRLKEWRKARKRDLESPPPDGVATWQRMDEAATEDEEVAAAARAAAEREALRLPPPAPETPTPPPGINLAPPGPPGQDWRDEVHGATDDIPLLGFLDDDNPPAPLLDPVPLPTDQVDHPHPDDVQFGMSGDPGFDPRFATVEEPTPLAVPDPELAELNELPPPIAYAIDRPAYEPSPYGTADTFDPPAAEPTTDFAGFAGFDPPAAEPTTDVAGFDPPAAEPTTDFAGFGPPTDTATDFAGFDHPAFDETPFEETPFEPAAHDEPAAPVSFEPSFDPLAPSFDTPAPVPAADDRPPLPPAATLADFGLGPESGMPAAIPFADEPLPPPPAPVEAAMPQRVIDATPATQAAEAASAAFEPEPVTARPSGYDAAPIRPRTPTRIPAAKPAGKDGDAKAMLARIAALRGDKD